MISVSANADLRLFDEAANLVIIFSLSVFKVMALTRISQQRAIFLFLAKMHTFQYVTFSKKV